MQAVSADEHHDRFGVTPKHRNVPTSMHKLDAKLDKTGNRALAKKSDGKTKDAARRLRSATYFIDLENRFVLVRFTGTITFQDIKDYAGHLRADPRFRPSFSEIVDLRNVEEVELSPTQAMNLADNVDPFAIESRRAFVVQSQAQIHAAHIHRILRPEGGNILVSFSMEEAQQWMAMESRYIGQ
jgi:hypothetical protein